ncbi:hypothetical protein HZC09_01580, partial [Candidatus Micrarchaeota archaeon]|nr:hypothetical protein [Candidatus Micrarchaeota archaeon]
MFRKIEEAKVAYWQVLLTISAVIFVRIILEYALEAQKRVEEPTSLFLFFTYFWSVIAGLMLLVWWLSGKELLKVAKVVAAFSPLLWLPPFADLALSEGRGFNLTYMFDPQGFMDALLNFCAACRGSSPGLQVEIVATLIVAAAYVFWASRSLFRATACAAAVYVFILFGAFFPGALMTGLGHAFQDVYLYREIVSSYALFLTFSVLLFMRAHKAWPHIAERFRIERSMHYAGWALFGAFVGFRGWQHPLPGALLPLGALAASIFFAFEAAAWINDYFDKETDKYNTRKNKIATALRKHEKEFVAVFLGLLLLNGLAAGYAA